MSKKGHLKSRVGEKFTTNEGYGIVITDYFGAKNCTVKFNDGIILENRAYSNIIKGRVKKPEHSKVGEKFLTNEGYEVVIIEYFNSTNCTIMFPNNDILKNARYSELRRGSIKNPFHPSVHEKGYLGKRGFGISKNPKAYKVWASCIQRGYESEFKEKHPTYKNVTVCEEWHNFQNFAVWYEENYKEGFELDKDILVKGNKIYSPETCCFIPQIINTLFVKNNIKRGVLPIGVKIANKKFQARFTKNNVEIHLGTFDIPEEAFQVYKVAKEQYIKEVADKWKDKISDRVYQALYNYKVEITD